jgi:hypothetical protein
MSLIPRTILPYSLKSVYFVKVSDTFRILIRGGDNQLNLFIKPRKNPPES